MHLTSASPNSVTGDIYIADRSNAGVDIFSGSGLTQIGRAAGFAGVQPPPSSGLPANNNISGPDGVLTVTSGGVTTLYAGDGNSTLKVFQFTNPANPGGAVQSISTGGATRVDEMAFSPANGGLVLAANNAEAPAFGNLFQTTGGHIGVNPPGVTLITTPGLRTNGGSRSPQAKGGIAAGGMEQPAWNPLTTVGMGLGLVLGFYSTVGHRGQEPRWDRPDQHYWQSAANHLFLQYLAPASHRRGARRPDSPLPGTATC